MKSSGLALLLFATILPAVAQEPQWLTDARDREGVLGEPHLVTSADKKVTFSVPVPLAGKITEDKQSYSLSLTLGPGAVAECELMKEDFDVAYFLRETAKVTFSDVIERAQGAVEKRGVGAIDAGVAGATPYLNVSWFYRVKDSQGAKVGALQQFAASTGDLGVYCALNDLGYSKTFQSVMHSLLESLQVKGGSGAPYYSEISLAAVGNVRVGYTALEMRRDKDGDTKVLQTTALLIARVADAVQSFDAVRVEWVKPDGQLINAKLISSSNGETGMDLSLTPGEGTSWRVLGKFKNKEVSETIASGDPSTWLQETRLRREQLAAENPVGAQARFASWLGTDPSHFTDKTTKVMEKIDANTFSVRETDDSVSADLLVDRATGQVTQAIAQIGPTAVKFHRVYVQGAP